VLSDIYVVNTFYVSIEFEGIRTWWFLYGSAVISVTLFLYLVLLDRHVFLIIIFYLIGFGDVCYYILERGVLPPRFYGVWIWMWEPSVEFIVRLSVAGLLTVFILFWGKDLIEVVRTVRLWWLRKNAKPDY